MKTDTEICRSRTPEACRPEVGCLYAGDKCFLGHFSSNTCYHEKCKQLDQGKCASADSQDFFKELFKLSTTGSSIGDERSPPALCERFKGKSCSADDDEAKSCACHRRRRPPAPTVATTGGGSCIRLIERSC
eukprot:gnl/TRDRNA2_/TRDRNA2_161188_c0_seq2.p1 gnl/TRDRNA2_/TRDRNA2_161188_c0~~gnl/TRDRNA2_/TRDRNA2_161188_c0_seq2.p1  ORF type:complete len:132 (+),score=7.61 gnl/TRDRNA2_/TRDRNA2_161188_c0_seq2:359-754(+)